MDFVLGKWSAKACIRGHTLPACERFIECDGLMNRRQGLRRDGPLTTPATNRDSSPYGTTSLVAFMKPATACPPGLQPNPSGFEGKRDVTSNEHRIHDLLLSTVHVICNHGRNRYDAEHLF